MYIYIYIFQNRGGKQFYFQQPFKYCFLKGDISHLTTHSFHTIKHLNNTFSYIQTHFKLLNKLQMFYDIKLIFYIFNNI